MRFWFVLLRHHEGWLHWSVSIIVEHVILILIIPWVVVAIPPSTGLHPWRHPLRLLLVMHADLPHEVRVEFHLLLNHFLDVLERWSSRIEILLGQRKQRGLWIVLSVPDGGINLQAQV